MTLQELLRHEPTQSAVLGAAQVAHCVRLILLDPACVRR